MLRGPITTTDRFFVLNTLKRPSEDSLKNRDEWPPTLAGLRDSKTLNVGALKTLGVTSFVTVLQCSVNGRAFFDDGALGS